MIAGALAWTAWGDTATAQAPFVAGPPVAADIGSAVRECLASHPLCVLIGEEFANRWVSSTNNEIGDVNDVILGAIVTGIQTTDSRTRLDIVPNPGIADMRVVLDGTTSMETTSHTPQAKICSTSGFQFSVTKQVQFPGEYLLTWTPSACLVGGQRHNGARTRLSGVPIAGPIASKIAIGAANEQKPLSTEISAWKLSEKVGPRFNDEVDRQIKTANLAMANWLRPRLDDLNLKPSAVRTLSTDDAVIIGAAFDSKDRAKTLPDLSRMPVSQRAVFAVHESLAAQLVRRVGLAGMELPGAVIPGESANRAEPNSDLLTSPTGSLILDPEDPVVVRFDADEIAVRIRGTFRSHLGPEIPSQDVNLTVRPTLQGGRLSLNGRLVSITSTSGQSDAVVSQIVDTVIRPQIEARLKAIDSPTVWQIPHPRTGESIATQLQSLTVRDGWLVAEVALAEGTPSGLPASLPPGAPIPPQPIVPSWEPTMLRGPLLPAPQGF